MYDCCPAIQISILRWLNISEIGGETREAGGCLRHEHGQLGILEIPRSPFLDYHELLKLKIDSQRDEIEL